MFDETELFGELHTNIAVA